MANAFKFTFEGGIRIEARLVEHDSQEFLKCSVLDTGIGVKQEDLSKLFKLFGMIDYGKYEDYRQNININPNGCGIGLTVSQKYIEHLNGKVEFDSTIDQGTQVSFTIPLVRSEIESVENIDIQDFNMADNSGRLESDKEIAFNSIDYYEGEHMIPNLQTIACRKTRPQFHSIR